jgi:hypothetical protein
MSETPKPAADSGEATNGRKRAAARKPSEIDGLRARLEGVEPVVNNAFQASGAALLLAILALALGVFLVFKVRGLTPAAVVPSV